MPSGSFHTTFSFYLSLLLQEGEEAPCLKKQTQAGKKNLWASERGWRKETAFYLFLLRLGVSVSCEDMPATHNPSLSGEDRRGSILWRNAWAGGGGGPTHTFYLSTGC